MTDEQIAQISGDMADEIMKSSVNAQEAKGRLAMLKDQLETNKALRGQELSQKREKDVADISNQEKERRQAALKALPWYTDFLPSVLTSKKNKALEEEAGIGADSPTGGSSAPSVGSTFNGKKVLAVRKVK